MDIAYHNGNFIPLEEVRIHPLDRGFVFGDGIYEYIPTARRQPFALRRHLERLSQSLASIRLNADISALPDVMAQLLEKQPRPDECDIYLQITRGVAPRKHAYVDVAPTVFLYCPPKPTHPAHNTVITAEDFRWQRCDIKSISLVASCMSASTAQAAGADDIFLFRDGLLTESSSSNAFIAKDGTLYTPTLNRHILRGITREIILELAQAHGIPTVQCDITLSEVQNADEAFLTSSSRDITRVSKIDDTMLPMDSSSSITARLIEIFRDYKEDTTRKAAEK